MKMLSHNVGAISSQYSKHKFVVHFNFHRLW